MIADTLAIDSAAQIGGSALNTSRAATVIVAPSTLGTTIGLAGGAGSINLTAAQLATMRGTNIRIGNSNAGAMAIGAGSTWTPAANFATGNLTLFGAGITQNGGIDFSTSGSSLILRSGGTVTLTDSNNVFSNMAASNSSGSVSILNKATNPLTVTNLTDDLGTVSGITTPGAITLTVSGVGGELTIDSDVTTSGGDMTLQGVGVTQNADTTINAASGNMIVNAGTGALTMRSGSLMLTSGQINLTADSIALYTVCRNKKT